MGSWSGIMSRLLPDWVARRCAVLLWLGKGDIAGLYGSGKGTGMIGGALGCSGISTSVRDGVGGLRPRP